MKEDIKWSSLGLQIVPPSRNVVRLTPLTCGSAVEAVHSTINELEMVTVQHTTSHFACTVDYGSGKMKIVMHQVEYKVQKDDNTTLSKDVNLWSRQLEKCSDGYWRGT